MKRVAVAALVVAFVGVAGLARAEDKSDPNGTWKWTINFGNQSREVTLKLKQDGDKLTGTITAGRDNKETPIEDGQYKDGNASWKVTRERDGNKFVIKYSGKITGDTLKGKMEFERMGETRSVDFDAKRVKE
jgi:hypothetical protein